MADVGIAVGIIVLVGAILYIGNASMTRRHNAGSTTHADFVGVAKTDSGDDREGRRRHAAGQRRRIYIFGIAQVESGSRCFQHTPSADDRHYKWTEISWTQLRQHPTKPLPGFVDITLSNGSTVTFRVNLFGKLSKALAQSAPSAPDLPSAG